MTTEILSLETTAQEINALHGELVSHCSEAVSKAISIGYKLELLRNQGTSLPDFVRQHCQFSMTTARRYVRAARKHAQQPSVTGEHSNLVDLLAVCQEDDMEEREATEKLVREMLLEGHHQKEVTEAARIDKRRVKKIYEDVVIPELLEVDWVAESKKHPAPMLYAHLHLRHVMAAHAKIDGRNMSEYAYKALDSNKSHWDACATIARRGSPELIDAVMNGRIAFHRGRELAAMPRGEQLKAIATDSKHLSAVDELRMTVIEYGNLRREFLRKHALVDIRNGDTPEDLASICGLIRANSEFLSAALTELEKLECLPTTAEPKTTSTTTGSNGSTSTRSHSAS